jgi:hypothetical protein
MGKPKFEDAVEDESPRKEPAVEKETVVQLRMRQLDISINRLESITDKLTSKLEAVLLKQDKGSGAEGEEKATNECPLAVGLLNFQKRISTLRDVLESTYRRLQL